MPQILSAATRSALLACSVVVLGAAGDASSDWVEREARLSGAFGSFLAGRFAAQTHDLTAAATDLEAALRDDPGIRELQSQAFVVALLAGQPQAVRLAVSLPDNPLAQLVLADREGKAGRWEAAEGAFAGLTEQQGLTQVLRPLLVAWAQQGAGRTDAALGTLVPLTDGTRFRGVYALHAALIADLAGRTDVAARLYRVAAADYGPLNLRLGVILASWQARQGALPEAQRTIRDLAGSNGDLAVARQALEADVSAPAVRGPADGIAEAYLAMAATLRQQSGESAQLLLRLALDMRPDFTAARILLADVEEAAKRPQAALTTLAAVPQTDPLAPVAALRRASLLDEAGQSEVADRLLEQLAREHPDRPEPLAQQGDMLRRNNRFADAAKAYSAAIGRLGTPSRANWPLFYERGIALERSGQWSEAEADLSYALQLAPDQPSVLNYLAYSWAERGENLDQARTMLERAMAGRAEDGAIIDSLGWVLLKQGNVPAAVQQLERAVELLPEDAVINAHLGDALAAAGRMREAEFQWRRALNLKPEADDAKKLNDKLAALSSKDPATASVPSPTTPR